MQTTVQASDLQPVDQVVIAREDPSPAVAPVRYVEFKGQGSKSISELKSRLGPERFAAMLKINRIDQRHIRKGDTLVIPESEVDLMALSPFPLRLGTDRPPSKLILVSRRIQAFAAYESGKLVRWGPVSTGKKSTPTPAGLYQTNWKARQTRSTVNQSWVLPWCFNLDNLAGISFHQFDLPGYPASHGCVRLLEEDAKWIYNWADQWLLSKSDLSILAYGTPVVIFGEYSYGEKPPWKRLIDDAHASAISVPEIEKALSEHLPTIESRATEREYLVAKLVQTADERR